MRRNDDTPPAPARARPRSSSFSITVLLDMLSFGIIIPVLPKLVEEFLGGDTAHAAVIYGRMGTAWALMQFFARRSKGALSDRFGRRPVVLLSNFGLGLDYILMALAPESRLALFGPRYFRRRVIQLQYRRSLHRRCDVPEHRAAAFGKIGMVFGLGFILGPALGGWLGRGRSTASVLGRGGA